MPVGRINYVTQIHQIGMKFLAKVEERECDFHGERNTNNRHGQIIPWYWVHKLKCEFNSNQFIHCAMWKSITNPLNDSQRKTDCENWRNNDRMIILQALPNLLMALKKNIWNEIQLRSRWSDIENSRINFDMQLHSISTVFEHCRLRRMVCRQLVQFEKHWFDVENERFCIQCWLKKKAKIDVDNRNSWTGQNAFQHHNRSAICCIQFEGKPVICRHQSQRKALQCSQLVCVWQLASSDGKVKRPRINWIFSNTQMIGDSHQWPKWHNRWDEHCTEDFC